ncbi:caspase family protein [Streptomyces sp. ISL-43]|uniref:caspase family protein n=1 Tax=Streptomyces sp. ISL-43 TaxID=2819183 RepID=UPI001BEBF254|nr:caspase family protein [Streptomyces sp. ISL-43]MBT2451135.1 caspase family protein [Streptomyces sp. ISL-43]
MSETNRHALVVATSAYDDPGLSKLHAPDLDAAALRAVLGDPGIGAFNVEVLRNPTCQKLREGIQEFFEDRKAEQTLLLHFSCHGVKDARGRLFLAASDTKRSRLASTAVDARYLSERMQDSRARRVAVFLDCCYAGAFGRDLFTRGDSDVHVQESFQQLKGLEEQQGRGVITASSEIEWVFEGDRPVLGQPGLDMVEGPSNEPSLFTRSLVKGLTTGDADRDGNGEIGLVELADYVLQEVRQVTPLQTPHYWVFGGLGGDLPIAYTKRKPARIPPKVKTRAKSSNPERRLLAVLDLEPLLCGDDLGMALAGADELAALVHDDSLRVRDAADKALRKALPRVSKTEYHLGTVTAGSTGTPTVISLEGPLIVRETVEAEVDGAAENWLKARRVGGGIELCAAVAVASEPCHYEGRVLLRTAAGEVPVKVEVDAVPAKRKVSGGPVPLTTTATKTNAPKTRMKSIPFLLASVLTAIALFTPLLNCDDDTRRYTLSNAWTWSGSYGQVWPVLMLGLATSAVLAAFAWRGSEHLRRVLVCWSYVAVTLLTMWYTGFVFSVMGDGRYATYHLGVGVVVMAVGCVVEAWGCVALWRNRARTRAGGAT